MSSVSRWNTQPLVLSMTLRLKREPGAGDGAAGAHEHPGVVEVTGLPDKPEGIAGGDPVFPRSSWSCGSW